MEKNKYYIPDEKGKLIEVTEEVYKAYQVILNELKKFDGKKVIKKDGNGKR